MIHVVRNPVDVVRSGVNRVYWRHGELFQTYAEEANWQLRSGVDFPGSREDWSSLDIYERFMWTWHFKNERGRRFVAENPACGLTVRFGGYFPFENPRGFSVGAELPVGWSHHSSRFDPRKFLANVINPSTAMLAEPFEAWPARRKDSLERICGGLARTWGYDLATGKPSEETAPQSMESAVASLQPV